MYERFSRTELLLGSEALQRLAGANVAIFGIGGVGGYVVEALARSGIGSFALIDNDRVSLSNLNRQIIALESTLGMYKTDAARDRILDINPHAQVKTYHTFLLPETADEFDFSSYDYVVDAIDTVTGKLEIIVRAKCAGVPVISSMGAGNKLDPTAFKVADIYDTSVCPLAKTMRHELKKRGINSLKTVYSAEKPIKPQYRDKPCGEDASVQEGARRRAVPGSTAFVPSVVGLIIAAEVVKDIAAQSL